MKPPYTLADASCLLYGVLPENGPLVLGRALHDALDDIPPSIPLEGKILEWLCLCKAYHMLMDAAAHAIEAPMPLDNTLEAAFADLLQQLGQPDTPPNRRKVSLLALAVYAPMGRLSAGRHAWYQGPRHMPHSQKRLYPAQQFSHALAHDVAAPYSLHVHLPAAEAKAMDVLLHTAGLTATNARRGALLRELVLDLAPLLSATPQHILRCVDTRTREECLVVSLQKLIEQFFPHDTE